jgi:hypothetical protein
MFMFNGSNWRKVNRRRWILSSLSSSEEGTVIESLIEKLGREDGTNIKDGTNIEFTL